MAHRAIKPYSLLLYLLALVAAFFLGLVYANITEAGKGQMLAGGAIVLGYAVLGALIGLVLSLIVAFKSKRSIIIKLNILLAVLIVASIIFFRIRYQKRQQKKLENEPIKIEQPSTPKSVASFTMSEPIAMLLSSDTGKPTESIIGLGMFTPNFYEHKKLYFYRNLSSGKSVQEHIPYDSITFKRTEYGGFDIVTAPAWLAPEHLKLDYDLLQFKAKSISHDCIEIVVNTITNQTAFVDRHSGTLQYWPEYLLGVHSVEFLDPTSQQVHVRSFKNSSLINTSFRFMKPIKIQSNWMHVALLNSSFETIGKGWIQWRDEKKLLVRYSLLS
ncbi:hypothetical protein [Psychroserpens sp. S379A]|uniref:hypothetical protein n=1 Tax=Psychroserpens sp. S379A TaxID=3415137 RepID=UPI003C7EB126